MDDAGSPGAGCEKNTIARVSENVIMEPITLHAS